MRVGIGYDVHRLVAGRDLIIGGVKIEYELGLDGHSDADVLTHAIMDAMLGAAGLGDIGRHFPDTDPEFKGASSLILLKDVVAKIRQRGYTVNNVDGIIVAQKPRMSPYVSRMVEKLAQTIGIDPERVNVKATTTEGLGFAGAGHGIAAHAVVMVRESDE